jgi:hypothetical protein
MIAATELRALDVSTESPGKQPSYISAASGLVCVGSNIYVVADDELHLGVFATGDLEPGCLIRLFAGDLPGSRTERKRQKPDIEAIAFVPAFDGFSYGALLALGSASRPNRGRGLLLGLDPQGAVIGSPEELNMSPILGPLNRTFPELKSRVRLSLAMSCFYFSAATATYRQRDYPLPAPAGSRRFARFGYRCLRAIHYQESGSWFDRGDPSLLHRCVGSTQR